MSFEVFIRNTASLLSLKLFVDDNAHMYMFGKAGMFAPKVYRIEMQRSDVELNAMHALSRIAFSALSWRAKQQHTEVKKKRHNK